jgi:hypothetical protein
MAPLDMSSTDPSPPSPDVGAGEADASAAVDFEWLNRARAASARMLVLVGRDPRGALPTGRTRAGESPS